MSIEINGETVITKQLSSLGEAEGLKKALEKACALVERSARMRAPKDTGDLRRSISSRLETDGNDLVGIVYTTLEYAPYVEYGTGKFAESGNGRKDVPWFVPIGPDFSLAQAEKYHMTVIGSPGKQQWAISYGQKPHPFMRPALDNNRDKIVKILKEGITE